MALRLNIKAKLKISVVCCNQGEPYPETGYAVTTFRSHTKTLTLPLKAWIAKSSAVLFLMLSAGLLFLNQQHPEKLRTLQHTVEDSLVPVVEALSAPAKLVDRFNQRLSEVAFLYQENQRLRDENTRLMQWQGVASQIQSENQALRELVKLKALPQSGFVTARVVGNSQHVFSNSLFLDTGKKLGVKRYQAVISSEGLVGRVTEAGENTSRVMLITDINSRIPIITETSRIRAILTGDNSKQPLLQYVASTGKLKVGERIVTSSDGGVFPAGLPVGEITSVKGSEVRIQPLVVFPALEYVQALTSLSH